jgi:NADP-dependent 3-hydroxy-3-methylglutaryl-CoA reductase
MLLCACRYVPLPVGIVGPLVLDGKAYYVPLATTEGALVASTNRGCAAIRRAGGATTVLTADGMTRAPLVRLNSLAESAALKAWLEVPANYESVAAAFNSTSRFGRLQSIDVGIAGRNVYLRFKAATGDAMGMNMITKGVNEALTLLHKKFPSMRVMSLSGNMCTDKKPSAINWIEGRGKSVSAEVRLSGHILKTVLKTTADAMVELNTAKNLVGSALAGSIGGFNAHASNIVSAVYLATGQDPAQNVESSTCLTLMEKDDSITDPADPEGKAGPGIVMTVTMPSVEVGTVGGGTSLPAQSACLELLGLKGSNAERPGANAQQLSRVVAGSVLAGELSLMSALTTNDLLSSHMKLNRKHGGPEGAGTTARLGLGLNEAMATKLRELQGHASIEAAAARPEGGITYTTVYKSATGTDAISRENGPAVHAAASHISPAGSVAGGAPAGAHPHPLQMASHGGIAGGASHPGRRYFAAPSSRMSRFGGHPGVSAVLPAGRATEAAVNASSFFAAPVGLGVCEESRGTRHGCEEPMLCVP